MTNNKSTRKAFLSSVLALLLCLSMFLGTTLAWFTDSVTSTGNIIKSGTVEVLMDWADGKEDPTAATWNDASKTQIFNNNKWEPGYVDVKHIRVTNDGTLALKYQLFIEAVDAVDDLAEVIDVYMINGGQQIDERADLTDLTPVGTLDEVIADFMNLTYGELPAGTSKIFTIALKMQETADNHYQNKQIGSSFAVKLLATQLSAESDSFDDQYDAEAWFDLQTDSTGAYLIYSAKDLIAFNEMLNAPGFIPEGSPYSLWVRLMADIDMSGYDWLSINEMRVVFDGQGHTISNLNCIENGNKSGFFGYLGGSQIKNLTLENVTSTGSQAGIFAGQAEGGHVINCNIAGTNYVAWDDDSADAATKNGIGAFVGVSVETNETSGKILKGATIALDSGDMASAASGVWAVNDPYAGGLYTEKQNINVVDEGASFPEVTKAESAVDMMTAIQSGEDAYIVLPEGEFKLESSGTDSNITITGTKDTVLDLAWGAYFDSATVSIEGVTLKTSTGYVTTNGTTFGSDWAALYTENVTYTNCTFIGPMRVGRDGATFNNCTFELTGLNDYLWTNGCDVTLNGCTFNTSGKALLVYGGGESTVVVNNCVFNDDDQLKEADGVTDLKKTAIEIGNDYNATYTLIVNNPTVNGFNLNATGIATGTTLWSNKTSMDTDHLTVIVDGEQVYG